MKITVNKKQITLTVTSIILVSALIYNLLYINNQKNEIVEEINFSEEEEKEEIVKKTIFVDVSGAVNYPGLYELEEGARVNDAVNIAGGVTEKADLSSVNLAFILSDAMKVNIPEKEIKKTTYNSSSKTSKKPVTSTAVNIQDNTVDTEIININTATKEQLIKLSGIGEATAEKIINYRNENGRFTKIEDIKEVSGIGEVKYKSIKERITI